MRQRSPATPQSHCVQSSMQSALITAAVLVFFILLPQALRAEKPSLHFQTISIEEGMSQSTVLCMLQDSQGFMWFGTEEGLNRYDGYEFRIWKEIPGQADGLIGNHIRALIEDHQGYLWIGTRGALSRFDPQRGTFQSHTSRPEDPGRLASAYITAIYEDSKNRLWVGTQGGVLHRFQRETGDFVRYCHRETTRSGISNAIMTICEDAEGILWIGTRYGVSRFNPDEDERLHRYDGLSLGITVSSIIKDREGKIWIGSNRGLFEVDPLTDTVRSYRHHPYRANTLSSNRVLSLHEDRAGTLWVGTEAGLNILDRETGEFHSYHHDPRDPTSLGYETVICICQDRSNVLWFGTGVAGVSKLNPFTQRFKRFQSNPDDPNTLSSNIIMTFHRESDGSLWIGTYDGLNRYDRDSGRFTRFHHDPQNPSSLSSDKITSVSGDDAGGLWIGTYGGGLNRWDGETGRFTHFRHDPDDAGSLSLDLLSSVVPDGPDHLWIGTYGGGLDRFNLRTQRADHHVHLSEDEKSINSNYIHIVYRDGSDGLWIGTDKGLNRYVPDTNEFERVQFKGPDECHGACEILFIHESAAGVLWLGTNGEGLYGYDRQTGASVHYDDRAGLPNNVILGIREEESGALWISTNSGLVRFDPRSEQMQTYTTTDGLLSNEFSHRACYRTPEGEFYFGGIKGFNTFYPDSIRRTAHTPPVVITDFQIFGRSVDWFTDSERSIDITSTVDGESTIELGHKDRSFSFEFAALDFINPAANEYAYKLEGLENDWNRAGKRRFIAYTHVPPGQYRFRVIASNSEGTWNRNGASMSLTIRPPFWQTFLFRLAVIIAVLGAVIGLHEARLGTVKKREEKLSRINAELEKNIQERRKVEKKMSASLKEKEILLKEIHHRVKNNFQIISSLLSLQSHQIKDPDDRVLFHDSMNRIRSMALVHERLYSSEDFSHINMSEYISQLTKDLYRSYKTTPRDIHLDIDTGDLDLTLDHAIPCGLVVNELVSNAIKYAFPPEFEGSPRVRIVMTRPEEQIVNIVIEDNGIGLPDEITPQNADTLGLRLISILIEEQLSGTVEIDRTRGTKFTIQFASAPNPKATG